MAANSRIRCLEGTGFAANGDALVPLQKTAVATPARQSLRRNGKPCKDTSTNSMKARSPNVSVESHYHRRSVKPVKRPEDLLVA